MLCKNFFTNLIILLTLFLQIRISKKCLYYISYIFIDYFNYIYYKTACNNEKLFITSLEICALLIGFVFLLSFFQETADFCITHTSANDFYRKFHFEYIFGYLIIK